MRLESRNLTTTANASHKCEQQSGQLHQSADQRADVLRMVEAIGGAGRGEDPKRVRIYEALAGMEQRRLSPLDLNGEEGRALKAVWAGLQTSLRNGPRNLVSRRRLEQTLGVVEKQIPASIFGDNGTNTRRFRLRLRDRTCMHRK